MSNTTVYELRLKLGTENTIGECWTVYYLDKDEANREYWNRYNRSLTVSIVMNALSMDDARNQMTHEEWNQLMKEGHITIQRRRL
jgi:hypothetical protein